MTPRKPMLRRVEAAQAAVDAYHGKPLAWGQFDCARLAAIPLRALGYKPGLSRFGSYRSEFAARRALLKHDMRDTPDWLDSIHGLQRIAPAAILPADIVGMPGLGGWTSLSICLGNGRLLGFHPEAGDGAGACVVVEPTVVPLVAWSLAPCRS